MARPVVPPAPVHIDKTLTKKAGSSKQSKKSSAKSDVTATATTTVPQKSRRKKTEPSRRKAKKLARKMLALQRSTEPLLPKSVIKSLARDAAPGKRFTKSSLAALGSAVEAYAQGIFESSNAIRATAGSDKTLLVKHLKTALEIPDLLTGNGHPNHRIPAAERK